MPSLATLRPAIVALLTAAALAACGGSDDESTTTDRCADQPCRVALRSPDDWAAVSRASTETCDVTAVSKYLLPATASSPLAGVIFQDVKVHPFHVAFMNAVLADVFGAVTTERYRELVQTRATRSVWGGALYELVDDAGTTVAYGFDVVWDHASPDEAPTGAELAQVAAALDAAIDLPAPVVYAPRAFDDVDASFLLSDDLPFDVLRPRDCRFGTCDAPGKLCLDIPEPLALCAHFLEGRTVQVEYEHRMRVTVPAGSYVLDDEGPSPLVLVDGLEVGPERTQGTIGAGSFARSGSSWVYTQAVTVGDDTLELRWDSLFADGGATRMVIRDEPQFLMSMLSEDALGERYFVSSCDPKMPHYRITATLAGGERVVLDYRYQPPFAGSGPLYPVRAEVTLGGVTRVVEDPFRLVYAGEHHNWNNQFWILFDAPITRGGEVIHGVWIDETEFAEVPIPGLDAIRPLDAALEGGAPFEVLTYEDVEVP